jgi:hypothetical protein
MTAITTGMARAATLFARSPRIREAHAEAGPPQLECGRDTPTRECRSPRRRPGGSARPWRTRTTSGVSPHNQGGVRGDTGRRRSTAEPLPSARSGCTTHPASASTRPGAPIRLPREQGQAVPHPVAVVRLGCAGRSERGLPQQHRRQRSSESFADRHLRPRGWLLIPADERRPQLRRTQQGRRTQHGTSQLHRWRQSGPFGPCLTSRADRTRWPIVTVRITERVDG